tara:strand:- start:196 stop:474 length:279 start_codon:yes stop_codon:yes gene_type:complete
MNLTKLFRTAALICVLVTGASLTFSPIFAQEAGSAEKIQLMSDTLRAREAGNLLLAKKKAESLIVLVPNDKNIQELLFSINLAIEESGIEIP